MLLTMLLTMLTMLPTTYIWMMAQECGKEGQPCCYVSDASSEAERCGAGLTCIVSRVGYADQAMYQALLKQPQGLKSTEVMGECK